MESGGTFRGVTSNIEGTDMHDKLKVTLWAHFEICYKNGTLLITYLQHRTKVPHPQPKREGRLKFNFYGSITGEARVR